ncbi:hypothetical protein OH76DRAFT_1404828 [Lentinus brumalis]|uniref:Uncharacterized protein n=1 Tax=Lentinus brumalis TaxID=2498619 RepID=A0A371D7Q5_9APHY|nr:hypothetical protein OH76DRAFT_1404828 [Polyporus brumalis]
MSVEIHEVTAVHRSPNTSTGRGWERHMGVSDRLAPGCAHAPAMRWHAPALVLSMTRGHRQFLLVAPSHADNTLVENAPRPGSSRIQDIDSSVTWVDKPVSTLNLLAPEPRRAYSGLMHSWRHESHGMMPALVVPASHIVFRQSHRLKLPSSCCSVGDANNMDWHAPRAQYQTSHCYGLDVHRIYCMRRLVLVIRPAES